jgi:hypothetical protein
VEEHHAGKYHAKDVPVPVPQNEGGDYENEGKDQRVPDCPRRSKDIRYQEKEGFVKEVGKEGSDNAHGNNPPVFPDMKKNHPDEDTGEDMGKEIHRGKPP